MNLAEKIKPLLVAEALGNWQLKNVDDDRNEVTISYESFNDYMSTEVIVTEQKDNSIIHFIVEYEEGIEWVTKTFSDIGDVVGSISEVFEKIEAESSALERNPLTTILTTKW